MASSGGDDTLPLAPRGRDPVKRDRMLRFIRRRIWSGAWRPGETLPPRVWFEKKFTASPLTVQRAFQVLLDEEVLSADGRRGTRVRENPPHLSRYALVLYGTEELDNEFNRSLLRALELLPGRDVRVYFDLDCRQDTRAHRELLYGVENRLFAGLFFAASPDRLRGTPILETPGMPRVRLGIAGAADFPSIRRIDWDGFRAVRSALAYIRRQERRRVAVLLGSVSGGGERERQLRELREMFDEFSLDCPPGWLLECNPNSPQFCEAVVRLLFAPFSTRHPEALYVADDNFLPYVLAALEREKIDPERLLVVSHANFPMTREYRFPVKFFGFDLVRLLERSLALLDELRAGRPGEDFRIEGCEDTFFARELEKRRQK